MEITQCIELKIIHHNQLGWYVSLAHMITDLVQEGGIGLSSSLWMAQTFFYAINIPLEMQFGAVYLRVVSQRVA